MQGEPRISKDKSAPVRICLKCRTTYRTTRETCPKDGAELIERDLPQGSVLAGKYRIEEEIGRGGMGVVCRGVHIIMDKVVAIKLVNPLFSAYPKFLDMFKAEARALAAFRHPCVLTVHDFGEDRGRYFLVMELLHGRSLKDIIAEETSIPPERAFGMLIRICDAVAAAHRAGIVHLDLKGENVIVIEGFGEGNLKVLDFGLAQVVRDSAERRDDGLAMGTIGYMAPEQIMGWGVDERTDVYALGVLAFEMLTGELPFPRGNKSQILKAQVEGRITDWPKTPVLKVIPKKTRRAILSAVSSLPAKRPRSVEELERIFVQGLREMRGAAGRFALRHGVGARQADSSQSFLEKARSLMTRSHRRDGPAAPKGMVWVPAGEFIMGSNYGNPDQAPALKVPLEAFFIDIVPVTNADYARFVQVRDRRPPNTWKTLSCPPGTGELPVTGVTWADAAAYAEWADKRLVTEAEWEKAARGTDGRPFPWGSTWQPAWANWGGNPSFFGKAGIRPVGSFPSDRSAYGCLDMAGNVMEWTASWYQPYGPSAFRSDDFGEKFRVVRGGSYLSNDAAYLLCSHRGHASPETTGVIGFRCALNA